MSQLYKRSSQLFFLAGLVVLTFGNTLLNGYVWDDRHFFLGNRVYQQFDLRAMFFSLGNRVEYLPLRDLTYAFDYLLWGENPLGGHLTNLVIYLATVLAVYFMTGRLAALASASRPEAAEGSLIPVLTAALFAVHPLHCEAAAWITGRNVLLSGLLFFLSCWFYLRHLEGKGRLDYPLALLCFLGALLSKATALPLPLLLLLFALTPDGEGVKRRVAGLAPFFLLGAAFFFLFRQVGAGSGVIRENLAGLDGGTFLAKIATAAQIPFFYLAKLFLPVGLSAEYDPVFAESLLDPVAVTALAGLLALAALALAVRKRYPFFFFGMAWFFVTLIPVLNFFATNPVVADRYAYLPSYGIILACAGEAFSLAGGERRRLLLAAGGVLAAVLAILSFQRNGAWRSDKSLWTATLQTSPRLIKAYENLGAVYFNEGKYDEAFRLFAKTEELNAANNYYALYQGYLLAGRGDSRGAVEAFTKVLARNGDNIDALYALGDIYRKSGNPERALEYFNLAILSPEPDAKGYREAARKDVQGLLRLLAPRLNVMKKRVAADPRDLAARGELALALDNLGLYGEALDNYLAMERLGMGDWQLFFNIANIYRKTRDYPKAVAYYERCQKINPTFLDAVNNQGVAYRKMKQYDKAMEAFRKAIAMDREFGSAWFNLALTYLEIKDRPKALFHFRIVEERFPRLRENAAPYVRELQKQDGKR